MDDAHILALIDTKISALRDVMDIRFCASDRALRLQAKEISRRLKILNGEHATLAAMKGTYLQIELYDRDMNRLHDEMQTAKRDADRQREVAVAAATLSRRNMLVAYGGLAVALVGWMITLAFRWWPVPGPP